MYEIEICRGPECQRPLISKKHGLCNTHLAQFRRHGMAGLKPIRRQKTDEQILLDTVKQKTKHATQKQKDCYGPECDRKAHSRGLCKAHYQQQYHGNELKPLKRQANRQDPTAPTRICSVCHRTKNKSEFYERSSGRRGVNSECKFCSVKRTRINALIREDRTDEAEALQKAWNAYRASIKFTEAHVAEAIKLAALGHDYELEA